MVGMVTQGCVVRTDMTSRVEANRNFAMQVLWKNCSHNVDYHNLLAKSHATMNGLP